MSADSRDGSEWKGCVEGWERTGKRGCGVALRALLQLGAVKRAPVLVIGQLSPTRMETVGLTYGGVFAGVSGVGRAEKTLRVLRRREAVRHRLHTLG